MYHTMIRSKQRRIAFEIFHDALDTVSSFLRESTPSSRAGRRRRPMTCVFKGTDSAHRPKTQAGLRGSIELILVRLSRHFLVRPAVLRDSCGKAETVWA